MIFLLFVGLLGLYLAIIAVVEPFVRNSLDTVTTPLDNPTGTVGLTAVNGVATTAMRSDGAPPISQSIVPTWTGVHTFNSTIQGDVSGNAGTVTNGVYTNAANVFSLINPLKTAAESWIGPSSTAGIYFKGGNVGIGTTAPAVPLDVLGQIRSFNYGAQGTVRMLRANGVVGSITPVVSGNLVGQFGFDGYYDATHAVTGADILAYAAADWTSSTILPTYLAIRTNNGTSLAERVRIDKNGKVGIGTTSPNVSLDVAGWTNCAGQNRTSAAFNKTADTTLANVTGLSSNLVAGRTYFFKATLFVTADTTGGHKYAIGGTCTASAIIYTASSLDEVGNTTHVFARQTAIGGSFGEATGTNHTTLIQGTITVLAAGTLTVEFAQNASNGTSTVESGSTLIIEDIQ